MANKYVRSTDGSNTDDGSTWPLSKANLSNMAAASAAGDTIFISQAHSEITASAVTITLPGTPQNPNLVICANDAAEPPTTVESSALIATTGESHLFVQGCGRISGIQFNVGSAANYALLILGGNGAFHHVQRYENCVCRLTGTHPSSEISIGNGGGYSSVTEMVDCVFKLASTGQSIRFSSIARLKNISFESGGTTPTAGLLSGGNAGALCDLEIDGPDFSNLASTFSIFKVPSENLPVRAVIRNPKMPTSWSGNLLYGAFSQPLGRYEMYGHTNAYSLWIEDPAGVIRDETTIVATGGGVDGATAVSHKMTTNANANRHGMTLDSADILIFVESVGSSKTARVEIIHDSITALTNAEVWFELSHLGPSGVMDSVNDAPATLLTTASDQTTSTATWTTTGLTNPNKQKLEVTFTPQVAGWVRGRVRLAKPNKTIFVDPWIRVF